MARKSAAPLRGEDAWLAAKAEIAKRNSAARNRLEKDSLETRKREAARRRAIALMEMSDLPTQPGGRLR